MFEGYDKLSVLSPVIGYDTETKLFFMDDRTIGFGFVCDPIPGGGDELNTQVQSFINLDFPEHTTISFMLYRSPDIDSQLDRMLLLRKGFYDDLLTPLLHERRNYLREHTKKPLVSTFNGQSYDCGLIVDVKLFVTIKIPVRNGLSPTDNEKLEIIELQRRSYSSLADTGFCPREMDAAMYLRVMGTLINWQPTRSWEKSIIKPDPTIPLCDQFFDPDSDLDDSDETRSFIGLCQRYDNKNKKKGEDDFQCYAQVMSPRAYPSSMYFGNAIMYAGDPTGRGRSANIAGNYCVVSTIHVINHTKTFDNFKKKRSLTGKASFSSVLLRARPEMATAIKDYDEIYNAVENGGKLLQMTFSVIIFAKSKQALIDMSQAMQQYFATMGFKLMVDRYVQREMFTNCLPFSIDRKFMFGMEARRYNTFTTNIATTLLPLMSEWKGTGRAHVALISRTGQLMSLSLQDSNTNNNALIAAESGSGKSFYTNELMSMYMSEGARVWIIDIGRSYLKLCNTLHGEFISFQKEHLPCLNPFKMINDIDEEHDSIIAILEAMISPREKLTSQQESVLTQIFDRLWGQKGKEATIDDIRDGLNEYASINNDMRIRDMATQIYPFTTKGSYGQVFNGGDPITFNNRFTVLELEELNGMPMLRQVVLLQLIFQIQQAIFLSPNRNQKKLVMIDEAWDLLKEGQTAKFMEAAYRKFRKYGASAIIATQSIADLYNAADNQIGQAIAANSAFNFLLGQKEQTVEQVKEKKQLALSEGGFELLKTVRTVKGVYSEIFIQSNAGTGIGRLIVSDFEKLMFTTDATDIARINQYVQMGATYSDAINQILVDDGKIDYKDLNKQEFTPLGKKMSDEELRAYMRERSYVISDAEIAKYQHAYWSPLSKRLIFEDASNVVNPSSTKEGHKVGLIYEDRKPGSDPLEKLSDVDLNNPDAVPSSGTPETNTQNEIDNSQDEYLPDEYNLQDEPQDYEADSATQNDNEAYLEDENNPTDIENAQEEVEDTPGEDEYYQDDESHPESEYDSPEENYESSEENYESSEEYSEQESDAEYENDEYSEEEPEPQESVIDEQAEDDTNSTDNTNVETQEKRNVH
ncbi:MAG: type IV secretion system protein TraC [Succinivibrio sp.]